MKDEDSGNRRREVRLGRLPSDSPLGDQGPLDDRAVIAAVEAIDWEKVHAAIYKITGQVTAVKEIEQTVRKHLHGKLGTEWQGGRDCQELALGITQTVAAEWLIAHLDWRELEAYMYALTRRIGSTDEITQAVRDKLLRMPADGWHGVADRKKYLYGMVYNTAVDWLKREEAQQYAVTRKLRQTVAPEGDTGDLATRACAPSDVESLLRRLGPRVRQAFVFHKLWGYTVKEIAQRMSIGEETVKTYLSKAVEDLEGVRESRRPEPRLTRWFKRKE